MTLKEENDLLLLGIQKQCADIKAMVNEINDNLRQTQDELLVEIAQEIVNGRAK